MTLYDQILYKKALPAKIGIKIEGPWFVEALLKNTAQKMIRRKSLV